MAISAAALAAKAAITLAADKENWKRLGMIIGISLSPIIIVVVCIIGVASGTANHNNRVLEIVFNGGNIPLTVPAEYRVRITEMQQSFDSLYLALEEIKTEYEFEEGSLDMLRVKAVFYALFFGQAEPAPTFATVDFREFIDCFLSYESRTRPCGDDECTDESCEEYEVAIPITELSEIYANVAVLLGRPITPEIMTNISEIYLRVMSGNFSADSIITLNGGSNNTHALIARLTADDDSPAPVVGYSSPIDADWKSLVTCEFGTGYAGHTGMDLGIPIGTPIYAVADGTVLFTRASTVDYGVHLAINHGGGVVTLYAHNSKLLVGEGQEVSKGELIALSGSTGRSTGPHLHLEFVVDGVPVNPRAYL